ncbi:MAG: glycine zipper 2TM domain-containing protein [Betaproteobacteria bacterium]|nr:glycine zipper 2TM domain-containing protein [Betaproteobacteria bacterium]
MKLVRSIAVLACLGPAILFPGCATDSSSGSVYSSGQTRGEQSVRMATVESVREVTIEGTRGAVGAVAGGAVGGVAGSNVGGGKGSTIGSVLGAVGGVAAGQAIERSATRKKGLEITVRLENGELRAITQDADEAFRPGERVRLLSGGGTTRVTH